MASTVYEIEELELRDGNTITLRPLNIKGLRKFMEAAQKLEDADDELKGFDIMLEAATIALQADNAEYVKGADLEEVLDIPTIQRIMEVAGGVKLGDPNLPVTG